MGAIKVKFVEDTKKEPKPFSENWKSSATRQWADLNDLSNRGFDVRFDAVKSLEVVKQAKALIEKLEQTINEREQ